MGFLGVDWAFITFVILGPVDGTVAAILILRLWPLLKRLDRRRRTALGRWIDRQAELEAIAQERDYRIEASGSMGPQRGYR